MLGLLTDHRARGDQLYTRCKVPPIRSARSLSDIRSVRRKPFGRRGSAAEDVAAAHDERQFHPQGVGLSDLTSEGLQNGRRDPRGLIAHQGFARELQQDSAVAKWLLCRHRDFPPPGRYGGERIRLGLFPQDKTGEALHLDILADPAHRIRD